MALTLLLSSFFVQTQPVTVVYASETKTVFGSNPSTGRYPVTAATEHAQYFFETEDEDVNTDLVIYAETLLTYAAHLKMYMERI